jgi:hypothetical protein
MIMRFVVDTAAWFVAVVRVRLLLSGACLQGIRVIRLVCRRLAEGWSVVCASWIALVPC